MRRHNRKLVLGQCAPQNFRMDKDPRQIIAALSIAGLTQAEIARFIGCTQAFVSQVARGHRTMTRAEHVQALRALQRRYRQRIDKARRQVLASIGYGED